MLEVLKTLESQFQKKGLLSNSEERPFYPLWFLAETERNAFLWRHGRSLTQKHDFEFWIDVQELISKRLDQLDNLENGSHCINPVWGMPVLNQDLANKEKEYLFNLAALIKKIQRHAHALSHVGLIIEKETAMAAERKRAVVLPN